MSYWYLEWFNEDYLELYSHRNEVEAEQQVKFILEQLSDPPPNSSGSPTPTPVPTMALDAACGAGRHLRALARQGVTAVGIDASWPLLQSGASHPDATRMESNTVRGNIRSLPFAPGSFSLLLSMFTSFGYFSTDEENMEALLEFRRVIQSQGMLLIDFLNTPHVLKNLEPYSEELRNGKRVTQERFLSDDRRRIEKRIRIYDSTHNSDSKERSNPKEFRESVRLFTRTELHQLLKESNFSLTDEWGNWNGEKWSELSPRLIILAQKA